MCSLRADTCSVRPRAESPVAADTSHLPPGYAHASSSFPEWPGHTPSNRTASPGSLRAADTPAPAARPDEVAEDVEVAPNSERRRDLPAPCGGETPLDEDTVPLIVSEACGTLGDTLPMWPPAHLEHLGPAALAARRAETGLAPLARPASPKASLADSLGCIAQLGNTPDFLPGPIRRAANDGEDEQHLRLGLLEDQQELLSKELLELHRRQEEALEEGGHLLALEARRKALGLEILEVRCQLRGGVSLEPPSCDAGVAPGPRADGQAPPVAAEVGEVQQHQQQLAERLLRPVAETLEKLRSHFEEKQEAARHKAWQASGELGGVFDRPASSPGTTATCDGLSNCGLYFHGNAGHSTATPGSTPGSAAVHHQIGAADLCDVGEEDECSSSDEEPDDQLLGGADMEARLAEVLAKLGGQLGVLEEIAAMAIDLDVAEEPAD